MGDLVVFWDGLGAILGLLGTVLGPLGAILGAQGAFWDGGLSRQSWGLLEWSLGGMLAQLDF